MIFSRMLRQTFRGLRGSPVAAFPRAVVFQGEKLFHRPATGYDVRNCLSPGERDVISMEATAGA